MKRKLKGSYKFYGELLKKEQQRDPETGRFICKVPKDIVEEILLEALRMVTDEDIYFRYGVWLELGVNRKIVHRWVTEEFEEFYPLYEKIVEQVEQNLLHAALSGEVKERMSIFILKAKHDWKDKIDVTTDNKAMTGIINVTTTERSDDDA